MIDLLRNILQVASPNSISLVNLGIHDEQKIEQILEVLFELEENTV